MSRHLGYKPIKTRREELIEAVLTGDFTHVLERIGNELDSMIVREYHKA